MIKDLVHLFLKLGFFAYGGPASHIAMMREEVVDKKAWFTDQEFLDMLSFTNLIPGPNSTEMAIMIGYKKAGLLGLVTAGLCFIVPAVGIVMFLTMFYVRYQQVPQFQNIFKGMLPSIFLIISMAVFKLSKKTIKNNEMMILLVIFSIMILLGLSEFVVLLFGGLYYYFKSRKSKVLAVEPFSFSMLFFTFLKIGAVLYGSGYVLISFLQTELVHKLDWLTQSQLIDLVAIGEITPGPVFTTATAVGYFLGGVKGSLLATAGIFIPSFLFIAILAPLYEKLKEMAWIQAVLKGLSVASLAIMVSVSIDLAVSLTQDIRVLMIGVIVSIASIIWKPKSPQLILLGAFLGLIVFSI